MSTSPSQQWVSELAAWAIDPAILEGVAESPYTFCPELFRAEVLRPDGRAPESPLLAVARERLPAGGSVLDVGSGAGAASLPLAPPAARIVAVDSQPSMLDALVDAAREQRIDVTRVDGAWPDVADHVPACDVAVCAHVAYNVADLGGFALALAAHARRRVALELHAAHPWVDLAPLWQHFHHQPRPAGPTAGLAIAVLAEHGIAVQSREWQRAAPALHGELLATYVAYTCRRLCLPAERQPEVAAALTRHPPQPRRSVVLWWDT
jgi:SAM-dependent methyltransferase